MAIQVFHRFAALPDRLPAPTINQKERGAGQKPFLVGMGMIFLVALSACSAFRFQSPSTVDRAAFPGAASRGYPYQVVSVIWRDNLVKPDISSINEPHQGVPAVSADHSLVFSGASDGSLSCHEANSGTTRWRKLSRGPIDSQPLVKDELVYVGSTDGMVSAYRTRDGAEIWSYRVPGSVEGQLVLSGVKLLVVTDTNTLTCLNAQTGVFVWTYRRDVPTDRFQVKGVSSPTVVGDRVYVGFSDGFLVMVSLHDGSLQASRKLSEQGDRFTDVDTTPLLLDKLLYAGSFGSGVFALDPESLEVKWRYKAEGPSSFALRDGTLYFSTAASALVALDARSGKEQWVFKTRKGQVSQPVVSDLWLFASSSEYSLLVLDRKTGQLIQMMNPGKGSNAAPLVDDERLYWTSNGQILYAMRLNK